MSEAWKGAAFLDRDGVINEEVNYLHEPEKTVLVPGVAEALNLIHRHGYLAVVVTNQSGIARGMYGEPEMHSVHAKIRELLAPSGADLMPFISALTRLRQSAAAGNLNRGCCRKLRRI